MQETNSSLLQLLDSPEGKERLVRLGEEYLRTRLRDAYKHSQMIDHWLSKHKEKLNAEPREVHAERDNGNDNSGSDAATGRDL